MVHGIARPACPSSFPSKLLVIVGALRLVASLSAGAPPQCDTSRTSIVPSWVEGLVVRSASARSTADSARIFAWFGIAHRTTSSRILRRQLATPAGSQLDTLRLAASLRELRSQRLYSAVELSVAHCAGSDSVDLALLTRDSWTLHPLARVLPPDVVSLGLEDRNVFGLGQSLQLTRNWNARGHGGSIAFTDPWLFGSDVLVGMRLSDVAGAHYARLSVRHHELNSFDAWRVEGAVIRQGFTAPLGAGVRGPSVLVTGLIGRLVGGTTRVIRVPYIGVELDSADLTRVPRPGQADTSVQRRFVGVQLGVLQRTVRYDTVGWFARRGFIDVPLGVEADLSLTPGVERSFNTRAARFDAWVGRMFVPADGVLLIGDLWAYGLAGGRALPRNQITRASLSAYANAANGYWNARVMSERLVQLAPDYRALSLVGVATDPTLAAVPRAFRGARGAFLASIERNTHLLDIGRASVLDAGVFGAASLRWDIPGRSASDLRLAVAGARLRVQSANGVLSSLRLDIATPIAASQAVVHRALASVSLSTSLESARQRDGRRRQQL